MIQRRVTDAQRPMRVAYFAGTMRPGHDGVTRVLYRTIDALLDRGIDSVFYSPIVPPAEAYQVEMVEVPSVSIPVYKDYRFALPGTRHFEDHLSAFRPDLIHVNSPCPLGHAALRYARGRGIPAVATYHTHFPSYAKYYKVRSLENFGWNYLRHFYHHCRRVYVPSMPILHELGRHGIPNLKHLPHGVDTTTFHPRHRSRLWKEQLGIAGKFVLLFAGRLVWEKDLRTLAECYSLLAARRTDVAFVLVGDGPVQSELKRLMPDALFLGQQSGIELSTSYASSDLFVFPSTTETFGNVIVEAMASGIVPICASEGGAWGSVEQGITGMVTRPRDAGDLAEKIGFLLDNPGARAAMADLALRHARRQTWGRIFENLFADYEEIIHDFRHTAYRWRNRAA